MKFLAENKKVRFDYEILETFEAGVVLTGQEVKSVMDGRANLTASYVVVKPNSAYLLNVKIPAYQPKNTPANYEPDRSRQLLLHKKQMGYLFGRAKERGLTIVPLSLYNKNRRIKVSIGLARSKRKQDKREIIKKRETDREIRRTLKY
ncbi:MAG: SsrA-binding protein SmpB [Candidatus Pacebacteria bacterium]|nr:SsrA-binding protein SmpB [Candidatus Paceibacterota bacterium]